MHLKALQQGDAVLAKGPMGQCVFRQDYRKIGFLIGGIGITPVISIFEYIVKKNLKTEAVLLYSNLREDRIPFKKELDAWTRDHSNLRVVYTVVEQEPRDAGISYGRIDKEFLSKHLPRDPDIHVFIFGPPRMEKDMEDLCLEAGCSREKLHAEKFAGY